MKISNLSSFFSKEKAYAAVWFNIDERIRFAIAAAINMGIRYILFVVMLVLFKTMHYQMVLALMWFLSSFIAFYSYKKLVFRTVGNHLKEYTKSITTWTISYIINALLLSFMVKNLNWNVGLAQGAAILVIMVVNYLMFKHFAFKKEMSRWEKFLELFDNFSK